MTQADPNKEERRLQALSEYNILDSMPEAELDALTQLASTICDTPIALISLIDEHRQWFKSKVGLDITETPRGLAFCAHAIQGDDIYEIPNALESNLFSQNPLVTGSPDIRFYAGAPLISPEGYKLGTLCVIDTVPKKLNEKQKETLRILSGFIINHFELRKKSQQLKESEEKYHQIVDDIADIIYTSDVQGNFTYVNRNTERILGYKPEELIGKNFRDLIEPKYKERISRFYFEQFKSRQKESTLEFPVIMRNGRIKWVEQKVMLNLDGDRIKGFQSVVRDIDPRWHAEQMLKKARREMEEARNMLQSILDNVASIIFIKDKEGRYLLINKQYEKINGISQNDIYLKTDYDFRPKEQADELRGSDKRLFETKESITFEQKINSNGKTLTLLTTKVPLRDEQGEIYALCGMATDISSQKEIQLMLEERDERFTKLFHSSPVAMSLASMEPRKFVEINQAFEKLTEFNQAEILHKNSAEIGILTEEERQKLSEAFSEKGFLRNKEVVLNTKSKEKKHVLISASIIEIDKKSFALNVYIDISIRKKFEQELLKTKSLLTEAMTIGRLGSFENNIIDHTVTWSNEIFSMLEMDVNSDPLDYISYIRAIHVDDLPMVLASIEKTYATKASDITVNRFITAKGNIKWIETRTVPQLDKDGNICLFRGTMQDITERKILEQQLRDAKDTAEKSVIAKEHFLSNMSHEIRTPMNAVLGFTELLMDTPLNAEQKDFLVAIQTSGKNLMSIINDILDYSKIEAGMMTIEQVPMSVREIFSSLSVLFNHKKADIALSFTTDPAIPQNLSGDPTRLTQIIINLVSNALKFTEKGSVTVTAMLDKKTEHVVHVKFAVADTGIGIAEDKIDAVFERFNQATNDTTRKYGGTGLGLSIVKRLVELQGGSIHLKSSVGVGSVFEFTIPFEEQNDKTANDLQANTHRVIPSEERKLHILLVEDNVINQKLAEKHLSNFGYTVDIAGNGKIALERLQMAAYDLVLMDMQMPEMDGYEAAHNIRNQLKLTLPIIAMTAHAMSGEKEKCLAVGMNDYISKPFKAADLYEKINSQMLAVQAATPTASPSDKIPSTHAIDLTELREMSDNSAEFIQEMLDLFVSEMTTHLQQLEASIECGEDEKTAYVAHKLKSSITMIGMDPKLLDLLSEMEHLAKTDTENKKSMLSTHFLQFEAASRTAIAEAVAVLHAMQS